MGKLSQIIQMDSKYDHKSSYKKGGWDFTTE